jgi:hypothetical protein
VTTEIRVGAHEFRNLFGWYAERAPPARSPHHPPWQAVRPPDRSTPPARNRELTPTSAPVA